MTELDFTHLGRKPPKYIDRLPIHKDSICICSKCELPDDSHCFCTCREEHFRLAIQEVVEVLELFRQEVSYAKYPSELKKTIEKYGYDENGYAMLPVGEVAKGVRAMHWDDKRYEKYGDCLGFDTAFLEWALKESGGLNG
jgi:hypothetical protein